MIGYPPIETELSLTGKRWILRHAGLPVHALVPLLLRERGIDPAGRERTPPSAFADMERAVARIRQAVSRREKVGIFGDYDADGVTAVAQLVRYFQRHSIEPFVRLPHRVRDGYGLHAGVADECICAGIDVLITADTGITAAAEVRRLGEEGIDTIITDHHALPAQLPPAFAVIHPERPPACPLPHPSGSGVVFQLLRALEGDDWEGRPTDEALVMIGTVADLVPLAGDNRQIVLRGLAALESLGNGPLAQLRESVRSGGRPLTSTDIAFRVAPRINAAGRMDDAAFALAALLTGGEAIAELSRLNETRQRETERLLAQVWEDIRATRESAPFLFAAHERYHPGIIGLLAGKLTDMTGRPSLVAHIDGDRCTGSLRSAACYNVTEGLARVQMFLTGFGGHAQAAGCTFARDDIDALRDALQEDARAHAPADALPPHIAVDAILDPGDITLALCEEFLAMEPFGQGNPEPRFLLRHSPLDSLRAVGKNRDHLQARAFGLKAIGFGLGHLRNRTGNAPDLVCRIGIDTWNGARAPQIFIEDIRLPADVAVPALAAH